MIQSREEEMFKSSVTAPKDLTFATLGTSYTHTKVEKEIYINPSTTQTSCLHSRSP